MIRRSGRTFSLLELANLVIGGRDRYEVVFSPDRKSLPEGQSPPTLVRCKLDQSVWLGRDEAIHHLVHSRKLLSRYYRREEVPIDPPKGSFTGVAVCGMCGTVLGPPNHHSYQAAVHRLHREKYAHLPFERFRSRIHVDTSEEAIEKWKAEQSRAEEFVYFPDGVPAPSEDRSEPAPAPSPAEEGGSTDTATAGAQDAADSPAEAAADSPETGEALGEEDGNAESATTETAPQTDEVAAEAPADAEPAEPESGASEEAATTSAEPAESGEGAPVRIRGIALLERHVRENLAHDVLEEVATAIVPGNIPGRHLSEPLFGVLRSACERARRSPAMLIAPICDALGSEGLKFFRRDGKRLYTAASKPRRMPDDLQLSERLRGIIAHIRARPGTKVMELLAALAPAPAPEATEPAAPDAPAHAQTDAPAPSAEPASAPGAPSPEVAAEAEPPAAAGSPAVAEPAAPTPASRGRKRTDRKPAEPKSIPLTDQQLALLSDLRWLISEGFVLEFSSSRLELATADQPAAPAAGAPAKPAAAAAPKGAPEPVGEPAASPSSSAAPPQEAPAVDAAPGPVGTTDSGDAPSANESAPEPDAEVAPAAVSEPPAPAEAAEAERAEPDLPKPGGD